MSVEEAVPKEGTVVAIDGPAGAGKSSLGKRLAAALGIAFLNTGAMYRSLAREALERGVDTSDASGLARLARAVRFSFDPGASPPGLLVDGQPPGDDLASPEVESVVSAVARHPEVRAVMRAEQRRLGAQGAVIEGRDIGTHVFPDANVKVFLHADPDERAVRRQTERGTGNPALAEALSRRDAQDAKTNPLVPAPDARVLDTTGRDLDDVFDEVLAMVRAALS
ncbi:MAG TPA: (d)CMP kinase [Actinomycetota bacterium]|jgi:cytidylate kinase|nr:(d)CMP kinase [Actinomycetota bacterium]